MRFRKEYLLDPERAAAHAAARLHFGVASSLPGLAGWRGASLDPHTTVYDLNGEPLFYDFPVAGPDGAPLGMVRASAATPLGDPVLSVYLGPARWSVSRAAERATAMVTREYKGQVLKATLVCYAYPKLGIALEWKKPRGSAQRTIFDIGDFSVVPETVAKDLRGPGAVSLYDRIPEQAVAPAIEHFGVHDKVLAEVEERSKLKLGRKLERLEFEAIQTSVIGVIQWWTTRILTFCSHTYSHECFVLHGQENGYYCVVATGQMLLDFWRYNYSQTQIASAMGTTSGGTSYTGEVNGYKSLTCSHFDAQSDSSPTFDKAKAQIDANRPFDYSYPWHAMACAGYSQQNIYLAGTQPIKQLYLYDPSPVNKGTIRWETWGAGPVVDGFVYLWRP
jgi:hypothetical protein